MRKFDDTIQKRQEFKDSMKKKIKFTNPDINSNVESSKPQ